MTDVAIAEICPWIWAPPPSERPPVVMASASAWGNRRARESAYFQAVRRTDAGHGGLPSDGIRLTAR
jgi:hypothetical protein